MFKKKRSMNMINGLIIGGVAGSIVSFLLAPKSGRELRQDISTGAVKSYDKVKMTSRNLYDRVRTGTTSAGNKIQAAINAGIDTYKREGERVKTSKEILEETLVENELK